MSVNVADERQIPEVTEVGNVVNGVMIGRDGYLFLADGGHRVLEYATGRARVTAASLENFDRNITGRHRIASDAGSKYLHVIIPDKQSVLSSYLPVSITTRLGELCVGHCELKDSILYPDHTLGALGPSGFLRTDTHFTQTAGISLAIDIAERLTGEALAPEREHLLGLLEMQSDFCGDLGSKLEPNQTETVRVVRAMWAGAWFHNNMSGGNNGIVDLRYCAQPKFEHRLLIFGDSFGRELGWFLSFLFREVIFLRTPFFHEDIFEQIRPDLVVTQNVERYLDNCMRDEVRPSFFMYPYLSGRQYSPDKAFAEAFSAALAFPRSPYWEFRSRLF